MTQGVAKCVSHNRALLHLDAKCYAVLIGGESDFRPCMAEHRILRTLANYHLYAVESSVMAVEGVSEDAVCYFVHRLLLAFLDRPERGLSRTPASTCVGREAHVLTFSVYNFNGIRSQRMPSQLLRAAL